MMENCFRENEKKQGIEKRRGKRQGGQRRVVDDSKTGG